MEPFRVGLLYFQEKFGKDLQYNIHSLGPVLNSEGKMVPIEVEHIPIHEFDLDYVSPYDLIIDRASHYFKLSIAYNMMQAFQGTQVVNNPMSFHYFIDRKDVGFYIAHQLGIKVPPTYILPLCRTPHFKEDDFCHHRYFDWDKIIDSIGFPAILKPANGRGAMNVNQCNNKSELLHYYKQSGSELMTLQRKVDSPYEWQVRCICIGKTIMPCKYIFRTGDQSEYLEDTHFLSKEQERKIIDAARIINRSMGYEMNSVEFIIDQEGEPWAIDFNNPVPDGRHSALGEVWYQRYLAAMVQLVIDSVKSADAAPFVPKINGFAKIARKDIPIEKKFEKALKLANEYYGDEEKPNKQKNQKKD